MGMFSNKTKEEMEKRRWSEIVCNYNNGEGFWLVDAWVTGNDDEEGKTIAIIDDTSKHVYYIDSVARWDKYVQEVINNKLNEIS